MSERKVIVMTGGTAGIGLFAADRIRQMPNTLLVVGARADSDSSNNENIIPLDLKSLESVRNFASSVEKRLGDSQIDSLVLNAATLSADVTRKTIDGFEETFAVNHLSHYLLLRLLMPRFANGATVVITTSNLHDPKTNNVAPPEHADVKRLANGQVELGETKKGNSGMRAYSTSKLCNVITAKALFSSEFAHSRRLRVIAFNPGVTAGKQLMREQSSLQKFVISPITPLLLSFKQVNDVASGGTFLADLALGLISPPAGKLYASQIKRLLEYPDIADLANNEEVVTKLWQDSADLVHLE
jgi:NAD(P)-dependent dehydrogenase (short-subunit alcohol dehydrogenase family)